MAKGNYGVTSLGGSGGTGAGGSGGGSSGGSGKRKKQFNHIAETFARGGFLPGSLEHGNGRGKGIKSISDIATKDNSSGNDVFSSFRKK